MSYPTQLQTIALPGTAQCIKLMIPVEDDVQRLYKHRQMQSAAEPFPFWARLWPSALALAAHLEQNQYLVKDKNVLELGAGIGLPSFVAAAYAEAVLCTDLSAEAITLCHENAAALGLTNFRSEMINWHYLPDGLHADTLLLSDVNYAPEDFAQLLQLIDQFLKKGTTIVLATPQRIIARSFLELLGNRIKAHEVADLSYKSHTASISIITLASAAADR